MIRFHFCCVSILTAKNRYRFQSSMFPQEILARNYVIARTKGMKCFTEKCFAQLFQFLL